MKIALVHDYLTQRGGAERVFELLCKRFPDADVFTSLYDPKNSIELYGRTVHTTALQKLPGASRYFRLLAPFYYPAFRALNLQDYDLIISSCSSFSKAVRKRPGGYHLCFCHNVTRFLWDTRTYLREYQQYRRFTPLLETVFQLMRQTDLKYSQEPDFYIANSTTVAHRIQTIYKKPSVVIHYPIDTNNFDFSNQKEDFYLVSSRVLSYKRIDVIVEAFNWLGLPLVIIGSGPERSRLQAKASANIKFLGYVSDEERRQLMSTARAVIVAALEDFGLVPIEANISGTPVIAYGAGGVLDTQVPGQTGLFFNRQSPESLQAAVLASRAMTWDYEKIRQQTLDRFSESTFFEQVDRLLEQLGYTLRLVA